MDILQHRPMKEMTEEERFRESKQFLEISQKANTIPKSEGEKYFIVS